MRCFFLSLFFYLLTLNSSVFGDTHSLLAHVQGDNPAEIRIYFNQLIPLIRVLNRVNSTPEFKQFKYAVTVSLSPILQRGRFAFCFDAPLSEENRVAVRSIISQAGDVGYGLYGISAVNEFRNEDTLNALLLRDPTSDELIRSLKERGLDLDRFFRKELSRITKGWLVDQVSLFIGESGELKEDGDSQEPLAQLIVPIAKRREFKNSPTEIDEGLRVFLDEVQGLDFVNFNDLRAVGSVSQAFDHAVRSTQTRTLHRVINHNWDSLRSKAEGEPREVARRFEKEWIITGRIYELYFRFILEAYPELIPYL